MNAVTVGAGTSILGPLVTCLIFVSFRAHLRLADRLNVFVLGKTAIDQHRARCLIVPLLDLFFSNKTSDKSRDEFVILVTPQPVFPTSAGGQPFGEQHSHLMSEGQDGKDAKDEVESKDSKE